MPTQRLKEFLDKNNVRYETVSHAHAISSQEVAAAAHVPGRDFAKTVMVKLDDKLAMVVLPANRRVNLDLLRADTGAETVELAGEADFRDKFPECELGAMPPFGNLYGMFIFVAEELADEEIIAFNAGTHTELVKMPFADFDRLVRPMRIRLHA